MKKLLIVFSLAMLAGCPETQSVRPDFTGVDMFPNIAFAKSWTNQGAQQRTLFCDGYAPVDGGAVQCVIVVHGGGFDGGNRGKPEIQWLCCVLARAGFAVYSIDYRLQSDNPPAPPAWQTSALTAAMDAASVDVMAALRWAGKSFTKIHVIGESAGAIAAVQACADPESFMQDRDGLVDANSALPDARPVVSFVSLWGGTGLAEFNATFPPARIIHGTNDTTAGASWFDALSFSTQLENLNVDHDLMLLTGAGHGAWTAGTKYGTVADAAVDWMKGR